MKILMTTDAVGGVWTYTTQLARALRSYDIEIVVAAMGPAPSHFQRRTLENAGNAKLLHREFRLEWMEEPWADVSAAGEWLLALADRHGVDLVHINGYAHAALDWQVPVVVVAHSSVCTWWQAVHGATPPAQWNRYRREVATGLATADVVVAPTAAFLQQLQRLYGSISNTRVIHNAVAPPSADTVRSRAIKESFVFACGRAWDEAKNLTCLDAAALKLEQPVFVAGDCRGPEAQQRNFAALRTLGALAIDDVHGWMSRASIFAHPAMYEPFGLAVLEAAQRGCALVLSDVPTLRELWEGAALFADPRDPCSFGRQLRSLFQSPQQRETLANAARTRSALFQPALMAQAYSTLYHDLTTRCMKEPALA